MQSPIPSFINSLRCLSSIPKKAEQHCKDRKIDPETLLTTRLFPDMLNLKTNVFIACDTAKGLAARLSQTENPKYEDNESTFEELQTRISKTIKFMEFVPEASFEGAETREVILRFGKQETKFIGADYLSGFATPNFYFHMATVHGILRHNGVEIGKRDFLGPQ